MAANRLKMDALTLVAASQNNDGELTETILARHDNSTELVRAVSDVAALLASTGGARNGILAYLDFVGSPNGAKKA
jgi:hypothetical protein